MTFLLALALGCLAPAPSYPDRKPEPDHALEFRLDQDSEVWLDGKFHSWGDMPIGNYEITEIKSFQRWIIRIDLRTKKESKP